MKISYIRIKNFVAIKDLEINDVENALILVGKNNTGKTIVIDAIRAAAGEYQIKERDFLNPDKNITISLRVEFKDEDLLLFHQKGMVSKYKRYDLWLKDFMAKLPSFKDGVLCFDAIISRENFKVKYNDGIKKNNPNIKTVFPKIYHIDHSRNFKKILNDIVTLYDKEYLSELKDNVCIFDKSKTCNKCFECIGVINKKQPVELTVYEVARLMEYRLLNTNLSEFTKRLNKSFHANGSSQDVSFLMNFEADKVFDITTVICDREREKIGPVSTLSEGLRSIFTLSLLEAYVEEDSTIPCIIMMEDPEIFLHPSLQKTSSEILYRLSKKNQVIFSTHSPNLIFNFSTKQIRQVVLDEEYHTSINEDTNIDEILDDLGYTANDLMNVNFVFIVEGKQDSNRLPLLLEKYYSEIFDDKGQLKRVSIIATNSCTNIKTYANLKYINKLYLKDQFLMIRDSDGKNPSHLVKQLCSYYDARSKEDVDTLPRVLPKNILVLKYYSFENYFLDPAVMTKIGVVKSEDEFYNILYQKYKDYLFKLGSTKRMLKATNIRINSKQDLKKHMETIKVYVRGHNLFDIFYGRYKREAQTEILKKYIDEAPRETFKDIFDAIDNFVYFENRKKGETNEK